jgi:transcriptional regulator
MEQNSFGLIISYADGLPVASHLPLLLDRTAGVNGSSIGHMARANQQWRQAARQQILAVFSGPHAYISPAWYKAEQVVPTWNYVAVHAHPRPGCSNQTS